MPLYNDLVTMKSGYILGLAYGGNHDSAAALLKDGQLIAAAEEERFTRIKFDRSFPVHAIDFCLKQAGISIRDVEHAGFFWQPWRGIPTRLWYAAQGLPDSLGRSTQNAGILFDLLSAEIVFRQKTSYGGPFHFLEHHRTHAASSFFSSPFTEASILTIDGTGETDTCWIGSARGTTFTKHRSTRWPHSLGHIYAAATQYLGFKMFSDEYKVMALAAYGTPEFLKDFRSIIQVKEGKIILDLRYIQYHRFKKQWYSERWVRTFGSPREPNAEIQRHHKNLAASLQVRLEEVIIELARTAIEITGIDTLCLSGGVALNAVAVGKLAQSGTCKEVFTNPVSGDAGCALGAAYYIHSTLLKHTDRHPLTHAYWGSEYTDKAIENVLKEAGLKYEFLGNPAEKAATLIADGHIIGWFQGRAEYGQRALGNRSILADPRQKETKEKLNAKIKHRESFRPFAPAIAAEHQDDYFENAPVSPFMTGAYPVKKEMRARIPAAVHSDGTARLQTVLKETNPLFHALIQEFFARTGVPAVLNTSFNDAGDPIVERVEDALTTFARTGLDDLIIGSFLIRREDTGL